MSQPIICLDFDGVVHSYKSGWKGPRNIPDPPVDGALWRIYRTLNRGYRVAIFSTRSSYFFGRLAMRRWLKRNAGDLWPDAPGHHGINAVEFPCHKPPALLTIDDRAFCFEGRFPDRELIRVFKPWNKRTLNDEYVTVVDPQGRIGAVQNPPLNWAAAPDKRVSNSIPPQPHNDAVRYLINSLPGDILTQFRTWVVADPDNWVETQAPVGWHFYGGMQLRNHLRDGGFTEDGLGVMNLDDVYIDLIREAVERMDEPAEVSP